jgi:hypothetical protein
VLPLPAASLLADVHVDLPGLPGRRLEVPVFVVTEAQLQPGRLARRGVTILVVQVRHADLDVHDRLGRQAGY